MSWLTLYCKHNVKKQLAILATFKRNTAAKKNRTLYYFCLPVRKLNDPQTGSDHLNVFNLLKVQSGLGSFSETLISFMTQVLCIYQALLSQKKC